MARWLLERGHHEAALVVARRHVRDYPNGPGIAEAQALAGRAQLAMRQPTPAYQHFLAALDANPDAATAAAVRRDIETIESLQKRQVGHPHARRG
jgi:TolA-binding protein